MDPVSYRNKSFHLGLNQRLSGRSLDDAEASDLQNVDISVPGVRTKRLEPAQVGIGEGAPAASDDGGDLNSENCDYVVTPTAVTLTPCDPGTGTIHVAITNTGDIPCAFVGESAYPWLRLTALAPPYGTGSTSGSSTFVHGFGITCDVGYSFDANGTGAARVATVNIAGAVVTFTQAACTAPPSVCPGVPPLAASYHITFHIKTAPGSFFTYDKDVAEDLTSPLPTGPYPNDCGWGWVTSEFQNEITLQPTAWRITWYAINTFPVSEKTHGPDPTGSYPDLISYDDGLGNVWTITNILVS